jgi:transposase-like protein
MMLIEAEAKVGAEKGKHARDRRTYFSGKRVRRMDTRLGTIYLYVPKLRKGGYVPFFVTERKRSELALATLVQEAFVNGDSTRRIERLAHALGIESISASQVSEINKGLSGQVDDFRTRSLAEEYPFLWIDVHYDKGRIEDRVATLALMTAHGVSSSGTREILAVEPMYDESEDPWREFFRLLKKRVSMGTKMCTTYGKVKVYHPAH